VQGKVFYFRDKETLSRQGFQYIPREFFHSPPSGNSCRENYFTFVLKRHLTDKVSNISPGSFSVPPSGNSCREKYSTFVLKRHLGDKVYKKFTGSFSFPPSGNSCRENYFTFVLKGHLAEKDIVFNISSARFSIPSQELLFLFRV
jgi:hypothetical protein